MTVPEFQAWVEFYKQNPFDDYHRYYRPAAHIAHSMAGGDIDLRLAWLERRPAAPSGYSDADLATMRAFGVKPPTKG
jgi:hypothetical protein